MKKNLILMCLLLVGFLTACSSAGAPEQIAAYSMEKPIAVYPHPPESTLIYNATLDMEVLPASYNRCASSLRCIPSCPSPALYLEQCAGI